MDLIKQQLKSLQDFYHLTIRGVMGIFYRPIYLRDLVEQMDYTGAGTLIIIFIVLLFIGMALSLQIAAQFALLGLQMYTGRVVSVAIISEIGPVAAGLVFAGRAGSGMASELGTMVLRHQVDTLRVFGVNPVKKLITPRIIGSIIMLPFLTIIGDAAAILGGYYISVYINHQSSTVYWDAIRVVMTAEYVTSGIVKPFIFGLIISGISCYMGLATKGGAVGLKIATTRAFVLSTIFIIVADFIITKLILFLFGYNV
jgi:phospholipid/cholesterol/gamma-HCH transport system permease protein